MAFSPTAAGFAALVLASATDVLMEATTSTMVPLVRKPRFQESFDGVLSGVGLAAAETIGLPAAGLHEQPLLNYGNVQYLGSFGLGTPPQPVQLLIDTGSSDLWVRGSAFHPDHSSTAQSAQREVEITYGQGSVMGFVVSDNLLIGGVNVTNQQVMIPQLEHGMETVSAAGVLGLAWPGLSHTGKTVMQHLEAEENISAFALLLTGTDQGSYLALGMPESSWYNNESLVWTNAITDLWWAIGGSLHVEGSDVSLAGVFLLDSGTSYIGAPGRRFEELVNEILPLDARSFCRIMQPSGIRFCSCEVVYFAKSIKVHIGGVDFPVGPNALFGQVDKDTCVLQVMRLQDNMPVILGDSFLRTVAAIFDVRGRRIGLAKRSDGLGPAPHPDWKRLCLGACSMICFMVSTLALCYLLICDRQSEGAVPVTAEAAAEATAAQPEAEPEADLRLAEPYAGGPAVAPITGGIVEESQPSRLFNMSTASFQASMFRVCVSNRHNVAVADEATANSVTHENLGSDETPYQRL